jgi:hypothetical protein
VLRTSLPGAGWTESKESQHYGCDGSVNPGSAQPCS